MSSTPKKTPRNCFACLKKAATRNALITMALSGLVLAAAISFVAPA